MSYEEQLACLAQNEDFIFFSEGLIEARFHHEVMFATP